jgi:hypothetical protein
MPDVNHRSAQLGGALCRCGVALISLLAAGCQSLYFRDAGPPPPAPVVHRLAELPFSEYWTGIIFNGEKIGFTRFQVRPVPKENSRFEVVSEASFALRFLGIEKKINLKARDVIDDGMGLLEFNYDYRIDGSELLQTGRRIGDMLQVTIVTGGRPTERAFDAPGRLHPSSVIALYPVVQGLRVGGEYRYPVYDGQTQTIAEVNQRIAAYEQSEFFAGNAFRVATSMHGKNTTTWIDHSGRPVFELALRGVLISALEDEVRARRYIALAALNKQEALVEFSLVRPDAPVPDPRRAARRKVELVGLDRLAPSDEWQRCRPEGRVQVCEIESPGLRDVRATEPMKVSDKYLAPSLTVQSRDPNIRATAQKIARTGAPAAEIVERILSWLEDNIEKAPLDVFSALDVLEQRKAECQGHAYLYTALARALGIPTRVVNGLVYSEDLKGFLFHSWAESLVEGRWRPVDPTFGQPAADATHIKLLEGEALADLLPLINWVGKLRIRVLALEHERTVSGKR